MELDLTRQSGIIPTQLVAVTTAHIIGAGAVGSHTAEVLCKMGIRTLKVTDFDSIEVHNLPNQGFYLTDIGKMKVLALAERLSAGTGAAVEADVTKIEIPQQFQHDFVVSAVDSMAVRKLLWESWKGSDASRFFVDGRMGARHGKVLVADRYDPPSLARYESTLHSDEEGYQAPCTEKATIFCAYMLGGLIGAVVCQYLVGDMISPETDIDLVSLMMTRSR